MAEISGSDPVVAPPPDVPHHVVVEGGAVRYVPLTDAEIAEQAAGIERAHAEKMAATKHRESLLALVRASKDPGVAALAELLGVPL